MRTAYPLSVSFIADARKAGRLGTLLSRSANWINSRSVTSSMIKKTAKIHPDRTLPPIPRSEFFFNGSKIKAAIAIRGKSAKSGEKVAYFAGCSAGYFFPEVGKATVNFLEEIGIDVFVPEQACCSMPLLMEGQKQKALEKIKTNVENISAGCQERL